MATLAQPKHLRKKTQNPSQFSHRITLAKKEKTLIEFSKLNIVSTEKLLYQQRVDLNLKKGGEGNSFGSWEKRRGVKIGVEEHA